AFVWIQARRGNPLVLGVARVLPFVGRYVRVQGLSDFAFALGNLLDAGVHIDRAWSLAGAAASRADLRHAAQALNAAIARGEQPSAQLAQWPCFPPDFVALYRTGET